VSWFTARRRRRAGGYAVVLLGLAVIGVMYASLTGQGGGQAAASDPPASQQSISQGKYLFEQSCSSCHGLDAQGSSVAPSLIGAGAAAVDFQVSTGRMPAAENSAEMPRKPPRFDTQKTHDLAAYIASLGGGPAIPAPEQVSTAGANVGLGQELFITNCAQCHNFVGAGGDLTYGKYAPPLTQSTPTQIYEAMQTGPEAMPVFNDTTITPSQKRDIIAYVTETRSSPNPGGFSLGRVGPVTEGIVAWLAGIGLLVAAAIWIAAKRREQA
jgi:ubiquinol-cytochrome c reductase cytochrome c subunit